MTTYRSETENAYRDANKRFDARAIELLRLGWKRLEVKLPERDITTYYTRGYRGTNIAATELMWMPNKVFEAWLEQAKQIWPNTLAHTFQTEQSQ